MFFFYWLLTLSFSDLMTLYIFQPDHLAFSVSDYFLPSLTDVSISFMTRFILPTGPCLHLFIFYILPPYPTISTCMSLNLYQTPVSFSVVEFANIIAKLHNNKSSQLLKLSHSTHSSTQIRITMASSLHVLVNIFYERDANNEAGQQDLAKFIKTLTSAIDRQVYPDKIRKQTATQIIFGTCLQDKALLWYQELIANVRGNWQALETAFYARFVLVPRKDVD